MDLDTLKEEVTDSVSALDYFTSWTLITFGLTIVSCLIFPGVFPLWFFVGIACLMTSVTIIGTIFFTSINVYNKKGDKNSITRDFIFHILPFIILFIFYGFFEKRFYKSISFYKSGFFPCVLGIIYACIYNPQDIYSSSNLNNITLITLAIAVWLSSYQIFIPI